MSQATVQRIGMALAVLLFAGACGGDGGDVVEPATTTTTSPSATTVASLPTTTQSPARGMVPPRPVYIG